MLERVNAALSCAEHPGYDAWVGKQFSETAAKYVCRELVETDRATSSSRGCGASALRISGRF